MFSMLLRDVSVALRIEGYSLLSLSTMGTCRNLHANAATTRVLSSLLLVLLVLLPLPLLLRLLLSA